MSNELDPEDFDPILDAAGDLRTDEQKLSDLSNEMKDELSAMVGKVNPLAGFVKPKIHVDGPSILEDTFTPAQVVALSKAIAEATRKSISEATYNANMEGQVLPKGVVPITDFSKLTMDAVYDLSIPIEAKEFMSADSLTIHLKDSNYEPRWVNKSPHNLTNKMAKGFTYIEPKDLLEGKQIPISAALDAQGHYVFDDVVAMKIDKATYYAALRAAHVRAINTTNEVKARERAAKSANAFMQKSDSSADYASAAARGKMVFYDPQIEV